MRLRQVRRGLLQHRSRGRAGDTRAGAPSQARRHALRDQPRPRFGAGVKTAIYAGALTWVTAYFLATTTPVIMGVIPLRMACVLVAVGLVEIVVATIVGAWLYKEA